MCIFTGAGVALVTPFNDNKEVDIEGLKKLIDYQIQGNIDCIVSCGTTGESVTLSSEEYALIIKTTVDHVAGRIPVMAGAGSNNTVYAMELAKTAVSLGVDGLLVVTPYYNKATQKGLYEHFKIIAEAVPEVPVMLYNVPGRTACNIAPETAATLYRDVNNIVAIKEASGDISQVAKIAQLTKGEMDIYSGNDDQITAVMALGGKGVVSVLANIAPKATHDICVSYLQGEVKKSTELQLKYLPLLDEIFSEVNPIPIKKALNLMGIEVGGLRMPLTELTEENTRKLTKELQEVGLLQGGY